MKLGSVVRSMACRRSSWYTSTEFVRACARWKVRQPMGRVGSCFDAVAEATFSTIKVEYIHRRQFRTRAEARIKARALETQAA
jgi:hypothetical protein